MIECLLENVNWNENSFISAIGYCFDDNNNLFYGRELLDYFQSVSNSKEFNSKLKAANGIFSVIIHKPNFNAFAIDRTRIFPLFYTQDKNKTTISDKPYKLREKKYEFNPISINEYEQISYVLEERSLITNLFQACPSSFYVIENNILKKNVYSDYLLEEGKEIKDDFAKNKIEDAFEKSIDRLIKSSNNRQLVLPLSGGYDSRLIACLIKKRAYKNVICYNVGQPGNPEHILSSKVAKELGFTYYFIDNSSKETLRGYHLSEDFNNYYKFSGNLSSSFWMYEYFGIQHLIKNNLVQKDAIFIPGHSGDFLAGSQFSKARISHNETKNGLIKKLINNNFTLGDTKPDENIVNAIKSFVNKIYNTGIKYQPHSIYDNFDYLENLPKYINNSARIYDFFGYEVRLIFWDNELIETFKRISYELKLNKQLYDLILEEKYFKPLSVLYPNEMKVSNSTIRWQQFKNIVKRNFIPERIKKNINRTPDYTCMREVSDPLKQELKENGIKVYGNYNKIFLKWNLYTLRKDLSDK